MTKEQTEACEALAQSSLKKHEKDYLEVAIEFGVDSDKRDSWFHLTGFDSGFQAAQTPEMLMLNLLVIPMRAALEIATEICKNRGVDPTLIQGFEKALAPFKDVK